MSKPVIFHDSEMAGVPRIWTPSEYREVKKLLSASKSKAEALQIVFGGVTEQALTTPPPTSGSRKSTKVDTASD